MQSARWGLRFHFGRRTNEVLVTWVHVPTISVWDFQRPIGIVALSLNHMLRNLGRALLSAFSSVSVEIALWRHVFLELDGFSCRKSCFYKNLCYGKLYCPWMSINVNTCEDTIDVPQHDKTTWANDTGNLWKLVPSPMAYHLSVFVYIACRFRRCIPSRQCEHAPRILARIY
jgi:hypothetical protein